MANYRAFHTQLATIMETLTRAAVAEICELVDDGYAILHMEISRHQKENEELRRKLQLIESIIAARGYSDETAAVQEATSRRARATTLDSVQGKSMDETRSIKLKAAIAKWVATACRPVNIVEGLCDNLDCI
ncbi:hypothetical protein PDJAM_G00124760 [Pangasius djambal]|uniref:Uncharacterized protein n=1 Tax=Pangasius djambal TaxID=1691987 RepID=A0ACC5ZCS6_9TELE|nr:hypothetical protein [Pangasius djambal]